MKICSELGCEKSAYCKGFCRYHYNRQYQQRTYVRRTPEEAQQCSAAGCEELGGRISGICSAHQWRRRNGYPDQYSRRRKRGEWYKISSGYLFRVKSGKRQFQHRVVMEEVLGRELLPGETVHHINGVRDDNRPENLELWSHSQPPGQRVEDKISWAIEFLSSHGYAVQMTAGMKELS